MINSESQLQVYMISVFRFTKKPNCSSKACLKVFDNCIAPQQIVPIIMVLGQTSLKYDSILSQGQARRGLFYQNYSTGVCSHVVFIVFIICLEDNKTLSFRVWIISLVSSQSQHLCLVSCCRCSPLLAMPFSSDLSVFAVTFLSFLFVLYFSIFLSHDSFQLLDKNRGIGFFKRTFGN